MEWPLTENMDRQIQIRDNEIANFRVLPLLATSISFGADRISIIAGKLEFNRSISFNSVKLINRIS